MENTQLLKEFKMTDKKVFWMRILIASVTFVALSGTLVSFFKNWFPGPIYTFLLILSFITLAKGVSYLSEILKKDRENLKILTGILSIMIFVFTLFPLDQAASPVIGWTIFLGLSISSILISKFSSLECARAKNRFRWGFSFLFALLSGIYIFFIASMILRNYDSFEGGIIIIGYSVILFLICIIANFIAIASLKNKNIVNQGT
jgi:hypothetical protein